MTFGRIRCELLEIGARASVNGRGSRLQAGDGGEYALVDGVGVFYRQHHATAPSQSDHSAARLLSELNRRLAMPEGAASGCAGCAGCALLLLVLVPGLWLLGLIGAALLFGFIPGLKQRDMRRRTTVVLYDLDAATEQACQYLAAAFDGLRVCGLFHSVHGTASVLDPKSHAGATQTFTPGGAGPGFVEPPRLRSNVTIPALSAGADEVYFLPDRVLIYHGRQVIGVDYADLRTSVETTVLVVATAPSDVRVVGHTWEQPNKDGGPDRRYSVNRQMHQIEVAELTISVASGWRQGYHVSRVQAARELACALVAMAEPALALACPGRASRAPAPGAPSVPAARPGAAAPRASRTVGTAAVWVPPGQATTVAGYQLKDGMVYVGQAPGTSQCPLGGEPSLIVPSLSVSGGDADAGQGLVWRRYDKLEPRVRADYLAWLADGRRSAYVGAELPELFLCGLERRVVVDMARHPTVAAEIPALRAELAGLIEAYGDNYFFAIRAFPFADLLAALAAAAGELSEPPTRRVEYGRSPLALQAGLAKLAESGELPLAWAVSWYECSPYVSVRTPASRCREEYLALFQERYHRLREAGFSISRGGPPLGLRYQPSNPSLGPAVDIGLPGLADVLSSETQCRVIRGLGDGCQADLDPYSRWLGRHGDDRHNLQALALLPDELIAQHPDRRLARLREGLEQLVGEKGRGPLVGRKLIKLWLGEEALKLAKKDHLGLAQLLGKLGFGMEPDPRFGGQPLQAEDPVVLFRQAPDAPATASAEYEGMALLLRLFIAVAAADGQVGAAEGQQIKSYVAGKQNLTAGERVRLGAHADWLIRAKPSLTRLKRPLEALTAAQREQVGLFLVTVAGADGQVTPDEVKVLATIYATLGLVEADLHGHLHHLAAPGSPTEPVTVRPAAPAEGGFRLPAGAVPDDGFRLDLATVAAKQQESAQVAAVLSTIFAEEAPAAERAAASVPAPQEAELDTGPALAGLDPSHSALVRRLVGQAQVDREVFGQWAEDLGLLPEGALDRLNEAALDAWDEPLCEPDGDGALVVNTEVLEELLSC